MRFLNRLKNVLSAVLAIGIISSCITGFAASERVINNAVFELSSLGIFTGDENGNLNLDDTMTRAEFAKLAVIMSGIGENAGSSAAAPDFTDVSDKHWAAGYISICASLGLMRGNGDGTFSPGSSIKLEECVKTILVIMGYEDMAESQGGYPSGYTNLAAGKQMLNGISGTWNEPAVRGDIVLLIWNSLDVPKMVGIIEDSDKTIRTMLEDIKDIQSAVGIVTANSEIWLDKENPSMTRGQIELDGTVYDVEENLQTLAEGYIGQEVRVYYKEDEDMSRPLVYNIQTTNKNTVTEIDAEDIHTFTGTELSYWLEGASGSKRVRLSSETRFIYNNRPQSKFLDSFGEIANGAIKAIDCNDDGKADYVFISEYTDYLVERAGANGNIKARSIDKSTGELTVKYDNIMLDLEEENAYLIIDADGKELKYEELAEDDIISVFTNHLDSFKKLVVSNTEPFSGRASLKVFVLTKDMDAASVTAVVPKQAKIGVVNKAATMVDEEGELYAALSMMVGSELKEVNTLPVYDKPVLEGLKTGDIIFFKEDADGRIENAVVVNNVYDVLKGDGGINSPDIKQIFGTVTDIRKNRIDNVNRIKVNQLDVMTADGLETVDVPISNYPDIFIYSTTIDELEAGTIDDIVEYPATAAAAEQVLIVKSGTTIRSIIIIKVV